MRQLILSEFSDLLILGKLQVWELSTNNKTLRGICPDLQSNDWCDAPLIINCTDVVDNDNDSKPWSIDWNLGNEIWYSLNVLRAIPTQYYLIFQSDGMLCRHLTSEVVQELRKYDYIGAPWAYLSEKSFDGAGGNGGFSFRNRDLMIQILEPVKGQQIEQNEDHFFSEQVLYIGGKLPPLDFAKAFSVETFPFDNPLGFHAINCGPKLGNLCENCPVINEKQLWHQKSNRNSSSHKINSCR